jgi:hypothetical protein
MQENKFVSRKLYWDVIEMENAFMFLQSIGFGLTVGWMWLFFLNGPLFSVITQRWG